MNIKYDKGQYITPFSNLGDCRVSGAVYDGGGRLVMSSVRYSASAKLKPSDPAYMNFQGCNFESKTVVGNSLFLGHYFRNHGHFLLETLPMLSYCLDNPDYDSFVFLNWMSRGVRRSGYLNQVFQMLGLPREKFIFHSGNELLRGNFCVAPRPFSINDRVFDPRPFRLVIDSIKESCSLDSGLGDKVFFDREPDRVSLRYNEEVKELAVSAGFSIIRPESLSFKEQVSIIKNAKILAGIEGSALHNALFMGEGGRIVEFGSSRTQKLGGTTRNQSMCAELAFLEHISIPYDQDSIDRKLVLKAFKI